MPADPVRSRCRYLRVGLCGSPQVLGNRFEYLPELLELGVGHCPAPRTDAHLCTTCARVCVVYTYLSCRFFFYYFSKFILSLRRARREQNCPSFIRRRTRASPTRVPRIDYYRFRPVPYWRSRAPPKDRNAYYATRASGGTTIINYRRVIALYYRTRRVDLGRRFRFDGFSRRNVSPPRRRPVGRFSLYLSVCYFFIFFFYVFFCTFFHPRRSADSWLA